MSLRWQDPKADVNGRSGAASYLLHLIEVARDEGIALRTLGIRTVVSVGEPGAAVPATHQRLVDGWGAFVREGYGLTELFQWAEAAGTRCRCTSPAIWSSPKSSIPVPANPSRRANPAKSYTTIIGDPQPLLRYRTGDLARLATDGPCACGFTGSRLRDAIEGRVDDMIWLRGVNVFPSAFKAVVRAALAETIRAAAGVELLPYGMLRRADARAKKRRVVDRRT